MAKISKAPNVVPKNAKPIPPKANPIKPTLTQVTHVFSRAMLLMFCFSFFLLLGKM